MISSPAIADGAMERGLLIRPSLSRPRFAICALTLHLSVRRAGVQAVAVLRSSRSLRRSLRSRNAGEAGWGYTLEHRPKPAPPPERRTTRARQGQYPFHERQNPTNTLRPLSSATPT